MRWASLVILAGLADSAHSLFPQKLSVVFARFAFNPKFREFQLVPIKWNWPFRLGPTGIFGTSFQGSPFLPCLVISGRSDRNLPFHLIKLLTPAPLFCILFTRTITKRAVAWVPGLCNRNSNVLFHWALRISEISHRNFFWTESAIYIRTWTY